MHLPPLLALQPLAIEILVIIIGAVAVWIWGLISGDQKPAAPRPNVPNQPPQNRTTQANSEIERFLQRANQQRQQKQLPPPPPDRGLSQDEQRRRQQRKPAAATQRSKPSRRREEPVMAQVLPSPGESLPDHVRNTFDTSKFEQRASHLTTVDQAVEQMNEQVQHVFDHKVGHLSKSRIESVSGDSGGSNMARPLPTMHPLAEMLSNPANVQTSVILSEIMQPPLHRWD